MYLPNGNSKISFLFCHMHLLSKIIVVMSHKAAVLLFYWHKYKGLAQGWPQFLLEGHKKCTKKLVGHNNVSKRAWRAKVNLIKTHNWDCLVWNRPSSTKITVNHIKCNSSFYDCVLLYQVLQNSQYYLTNVIFKEVQRAVEYALAGSFFAPGQWFGHPWLST